MIGGGGEKKTLRMVAEQADIWHGFGEPEVVAHKHNVLDAHCRDVGRDPSEIVRSAGAPMGRPEVGDEYYAVGTRLLTLSASGPDYDLGPVPEWVAWRDSKNRAS